MSTKKHIFSIGLALILLTKASFGTLTLLDAKVGQGVNPLLTSSGGTLSLLAITTSLVTLADANSQGLIALNLLDSSATTSVFEISEVLPYPNPMQLSSGGHLYYTLNQNKSLNCLVFDMFGRKILDKTFASGTEGGRFGMNRVPIDSAFFNNYPVSSGVYFILMMENGRVLKKAKVAVIP